jgi:hypothetical protein
MGELGPVELLGFDEAIIGEAIARHRQLGSEDCYVKWHVFSCCAQLVPGLITLLWKRP